MLGEMPKLIYEVADMGFIFTYSLRCAVISLCLISTKEAQMRSSIEAHSSYVWMIIDSMRESTRLLDYLVVVEKY